MALSSFNSHSSPLPHGCEIITSGGLAHSHFTRHRVISQTRRACTSPVPEFSQRRTQIFIHPSSPPYPSHLRPSFWKGPRVGGRGVATARCQMGFDSSEKTAFPSPTSHLSYALYSDLSLFHPEQGKMVFATSICSRKRRQITNVLASLCT